jgi:predicted nucleic acid-binding protein
MSTQDRLLIDSDALVWLSRSHPAALARLSTIDPWRVSVITYMELAQGSRNKEDLAQMKKGFALTKTQILPTTETIGNRAADLIDQFALSHGLRLADALIAATAIELQLTLLTGNVKHFAHIPELSIEAFELTRTNN